MFICGQHQCLGAISQQWLLTNCQHTVDVYSTLIFSVRAKSKKARSCQHPGYAPKFLSKAESYFLPYLQADFCAIYVEHFFDKVDA